MERLSLTTVRGGGSGAGVTLTAAPPPLQPHGGRPHLRLRPGWAPLPLVALRLSPPHPSPPLPIPHPPILRTPPPPSPTGTPSTLHTLPAPSSPLLCRCPPIYCPMCSPHSDLLCRLLNSLTGLFLISRARPQPPAQPLPFPSWSHTRAAGVAGQRGATTRVPRRPSRTSHTLRHTSGSATSTPSATYTHMITCPSPGKERGPPHLRRQG